MRGTNIWVYAVFVLATIALFVAAVLLDRSAGNLQDALSKRALARDTKFELEVLLSNIKDAETGQRGYLLTQKKEYLEPFDRSVEQIGKNLDRLELQLSEHPDQLQKLKEVRRLSSEKIDELHKTISLEKRGLHSQAIALVQTDRGQASMASLRSFIDTMTADQQQSSAALTLAISSLFDDNRRFMWIGGFFALLTVLASFITLNRYQSRENRIRLELTSSNRLLEQQRVQLSQIVEMQHAIATGQMESDKILSLIVERTRDLTSADGTVIELIDGDEIVYHKAAGNSVPYVGTRIKIAGSLSGLAIAGGKMLISHDTGSDDRVDREACLKMGVRSMIVQPLHHGEKIIGVLKAYSSSSFHFTELHQKGLELVVGVLSASWDKAIEFKEKQKAIEELKSTRDLLQLSKDRADRATRTKSEGMKGGSGRSSSI